MFTRTRERGRARKLLTGKKKECRSVECHACRRHRRCRKK
jgi:hypothetical protein